MRVGPSVASLGRHARELLERALELNPDDTLAAGNLQALDG